MNLTELTKAISAAVSESGDTTVDPATIPIKIWDDDWDEWRSIDDVAFDEKVQEIHLLLP